MILDNGLLTQQLLVYNHQTTTISMRPLQNVRQISQQGLQSEATIKQKIQSRLARTLRKEVSLPGIAHTFTHSWNDLKRETQDNKTKRKLNNQLQSELNQFFSADEGGQRRTTHKSKSQSSCQRAKASNSHAELEQHCEYPLHIKTQFVQNIPHRKGTRPTKRLAQLDIEDGNYDTFKSLVPRSPLTHSSGQKSIPRETPKNQIVSSDLTNPNRHSEPDSPVDRLDILRSHTSPNDPFIDEVLDVPKGVSSIRRLQYLTYEDPVKSNVKENTLREERAQPQDPKEPTDKQRAYELHNDMQKQLGLKRVDSYQGQRHSYPEHKLEDVESSVNELRTIHEVDQKSFIDRLTKEREEMYLSIPLSIVEEKPESEADDQKLSDDMIPLKYSQEAPTISDHGSQLVSSRQNNNNKPNSHDTYDDPIRLCSSREAPSYQDFKEENQLLTDTQAHTLKKSAEVNPSFTAFPSISKINHLEVPSTQVITVSTLKKKAFGNESIEMSPIQRSKNSYPILDHIDSSLSKDFGYDLFTPKHIDKNQSIDKLSPIYDPSSGGMAQSPAKTPTQQPKLTHLPKTKPLEVSLSIKYPPVTKVLETQSHILRVQRKNSSSINNNSSLARGSVGQLNLKEFTYDFPDEDFKRIAALTALTPTLTQPTLRRNSVNEAMKSDPATEELTKRPFLRLNTFDFGPQLSQPKEALSFSKTQTADLPMLNQITTLRPRANFMTPTSSPLVSQRPSKQRILDSQRESCSLKKKGITLSANNFHDGKSRSKSPISDRLKFVKDKKSFDRLNILKSGVIKPRSRENILNAFQSPVNTQREIAFQPASVFSDRKRDTQSPMRGVIRLGNKLSPRKESPRKGIKLFCEVKKHKYQERGIIRQLG